MRKSALSLVLALAALVSFTLVPVTADAGSRDQRRDHKGFFFKVGNGGFSWHGGNVKYVRRNHHRARSHYDEYTRHERRLIERRDKLVYKTEHALRDGRFERAQDLLSRVIEVDYHLKEHYAAHASCNH